MDHSEVVRVLKRAIDNTLHRAECNSDDDCYCTASEDRNDIREAIKYMKSKDNVLQIAEKLRFTDKLWGLIRSAIDNH